MITLVVGPADYAAAGTAGLVLGLVAGLGGGLAWGLVLGLSGGLVGGLIWGLVMALVLALAGGVVGGFFGGLVFGLALALVLGFGGGLVLGLGGGPVGRRIGGLAGGFILGFVLELDHGLAGEFVGGLVGALGAVLGWVASRFIRAGTRDYPNLWPYIRLMGRPLLGYTLGYLFLVLWFACIYASLYQLQQHAAFSFKPTDFPKGPQWGDFLFFAAMTFPPLGGYSALVPQAPWAQILVALESVAGIGWTTVVFAAIIAYRTPAFDDLRTTDSRTEKTLTRRITRLVARIAARQERLQMRSLTILGNKADREQQRTTTLTSSTAAHQKSIREINQRLTAIQAELHQLTQAHPHNLTTPIAQRRAPRTPGRRHVRHTAPRR